MLVRCKIFGDLFLLGLVWQYSLVGSKPRLLTCISNITLSLPSLYFHESKRELNFWNGYLSLLYFCQYVQYSTRKDAISVGLRKNTPILIRDAGTGGPASLYCIMIPNFFGKCIVRFYRQTVIRHDIVTQWQKLFGILDLCPWQLILLHDLWQYGLQSFQTGDAK